MGKFTPGPWHIEVKNAYAVESSGRKTHPTASRICSTRPYPYTPEAREEARANARLIAEAPAMYALLERIVKSLDDGPIDYTCGHYDEARTILQRINKKGE